MQKMNAKPVYLYESANLRISYFGKKISDWKMNNTDGKSYLFVCLFNPPNQIWTESINNEVTKWCTSHESSMHGFNVQNHNTEKTLAQQVSLEM